MADPSRKKEKRPFDDPTGEEAYNITSKIVAGRDKGQIARKATPKRGRGTGSPSGRSGRGSGAGRGGSAVPHITDNGGTEGKTIPIFIGSPPRLGEIDDSYLVHYKKNPTKRAPTKYDPSVHLDFQNYDGLGTQVKRARQQNPYASPKFAAIDFRFWSVFHYNFYSSVILNKNKIIQMKWVDWDHIGRMSSPEAAEVLKLVKKHGMKDLMGFRHDWNKEVIGQFHATLYYDDEEDALHWMTEGVHYKVDFVTFARLLGFGKKDREADLIHEESHMKGDKIAEAYEFEELADGTTVGLKPVFYAINNLIRETINPKGGSDSTSLRKYATNLLYRMLPNSKPFSVSRFIWFDILKAVEDGRNNLPYAPYIMYIIERVSGLIFTKDGEHQPYQLKVWSHIRKEEALKPFLEPESHAAYDEEVGTSSPKKEKSGGKKLG